MKVKGIGTSTLFAGLGFFLLNGCNVSGIENPLGSTYDLVDYVFPSQSGTQVYQIWESIKGKESSSYGEESFQDDQNDFFDINGSVIVEKKDGALVSNYSYSSDLISVSKIDANLSYHIKRKINSKSNFIQEETIRKVENSNSTDQITYECHIEEHIDSQKINDRTFKDILKIMCTQKNMVYVTVGGTKFENLVESNEVYFAVKNKGIVNDTIEKCKYSSIDKQATTDDGCAKTERRFSGFVPPVY